MKRILLILATVVIVAWGCSKNETTSPGNEGGSQVVPLAVGNWWVYGPEGGSASDTANVVGQITFNGNTAYLIVHTARPQDTIIAYYEGDYLKALGTISVDTIRIKILLNLIKLPLQVGEQWQGFDTTVTYQGFPFRVVDSAYVVAQDTVNVPAGNFNNAYKIQYTTKVLYNGQLINTSQRFSYIVAGVGEVKNVSGNNVTVLFDYNVQ